MKNIEGVRKSRSFLSTITLTIFTILCLGLIDQVRAQSQWTTASNQTDIYTTNQTGNVGIGTPSPGNLLQINSGAGPAFSQFRLSANSAGSLSALAYSA